MNIFTFASSKISLIKTKIIMSLSDQSTVNKPFSHNGLFYKIKQEIKSKAKIFSLLFYLALNSQILLQTQVHSNHCNGNVHYHNNVKFSLAMLSCYYYQHRIGKIYFHIITYSLPKLLPKLPPN